MTAALFTPVQVGDMTLPNRIVMAPMTRNRATPDGVPSPHAADYYAARATAGLIVTEGVQPEAAGQGYARTPAIETPAQIAAWTGIAGAVKVRGGHLFLQLMHCGRIAHPLNRSVDVAPVSASAIAAQGTIWTDQQGPQPLPVPTALDAGGIAATIAAYARSTVNALAAGCDGVELHLTTGYLPMQFLSTNVNRRSDGYGGSVHSRIRFVVELVDAVVAAAGSPARVALRISPGFTFNDVADDDPVATYTALLAAVVRHDLAYLHLSRIPDYVGQDRPADPATWLRGKFAGPLIATGDNSAASAAREAAEGTADLFGFGRAFIANPDLVRRFQGGLPLNEPDRTTFYAPGPRGYVDYPLAD